jgi:predicted AlkP superfamily pyrophosphatase or phosphodiesterase
MVRHISGIHLLQRLTLLIGLAVFASLAPYHAAAADRPASRLLFIGVDGCRTDALLAAKAPNLHGLIEAGAFSAATNILGPRGDAADTVSGPGWSNLLTGVWPDKHGVLNNDFKVMHYQQYPHFFQHVKEVFPAAKTYSFATWPQIPNRIVSAADVSRSYDGEDKKNGYPRADAECAASAALALTNDDPDAMFVYLGNLDANGHAHGFHPSAPAYREALETIDTQIGSILAAMRARPHFATEKWLVLAGTDHGGEGTKHGGGRQNPTINTVWLIVSGDGALQGPIAGPTNQVDLVATALAHLGVSPRSEWGLDGKPVGLAPVGSER